MVTKSNSFGRPASGGSALISTFLESAGAGAVAVDESQRIVACAGGAER